MSTMENNGYVQQRPMLSFGQAVSNVLNKYATFSGRARRSEYWYCWRYLTFSVVLHRF